MEIIVTDFNGEVHHLEAVEGWRVMEIIRDHGLPIKAECGGAWCRATWHVYVEDEWLDKIPDARDDELDMLDEAVDVEDNSRLSCQLIMSEALDGIRLKLAPTG